MLYDCDSVLSPCSYHWGVNGCGTRGSAVPHNSPRPFVVAEASGHSCHGNERVRARHRATPSSNSPCDPAAFHRTHTSETKHIYMYKTVNCSEMSTERTNPVLLRYVTEIKFPVWSGNWKDPFCKECDYFLDTQVQIKFPAFWHNLLVETESQMFLMVRVTSGG
jgi:hypothetical protein